MEDLYLRKRQEANPQKTATEPESSYPFTHIKPDLEPMMCPVYAGPPLPEETSLEETLPEGKIQRIRRFFGKLFRRKP